jgi:hypothetical protein
LLWHALAQLLEPELLLLHWFFVSVLLKFGIGLHVAAIAVLVLVAALYIVLTIVLDDIVFILAVDLTIVSIVVATIGHDLH